jgi:hypothetical protein
LLLPLPVYARHPERAQRVEGPPHLPLPLPVLFVILFLFVIPTAARSAQRRDPRICRCLFPTNTLQPATHNFPCQAPRSPKIHLTHTATTTYLLKIVGILVMLGLVELMYGSNPKSSFWHSPGVVILTLRRSRRWKNPRIGSASPLHFRDSPQVVPNEDFSSKLFTMTSLAAHLSATRLKPNKFHPEYPPGGEGGGGRKKKEIKAK